MRQITPSELTLALILVLTSAAILVVVYKRSVAPEGPAAAKPTLVFRADEDDYSLRLTLMTVTERPVKVTRVILNGRAGESDCDFERGRVNGWPNEVYVDPASFSRFTRPLRFGGIADGAHRWNQYRVRTQTPR